MNRVLATWVAVALCMVTQSAWAQDDDDYQDDPEAGLTGDDGGDGDEDGTADDGAGDDERPPGDGEVDGDDEADPGGGPLIAIGEIQAGGILGYDVSLEGGPIDPFGWALGLAAGVTLESGIYVGLFLNYHLGADEQADIFGVDTTKEWAFHHWGLKVGYDHPLMESVVVRPLGVLGLQAATVEECMDDTCLANTENDFLFGLGGELLYTGDGFYVGPELRWNISLGDPTVNSFSMLIGGGVRL